jgi:hypothetical protein
MIIAPKHGMSEAADRRAGSRGHDFTTSGQSALISDDHATWQQNVCISVVSFVLTKARSHRSGPADTKNAHRTHEAPPLAPVTPKILILRLHVEMIGSHSEPYRAIGSIWFRSAMCAGLACLGGPLQTASMSVSLPEELRPRAPSGLLIGPKCVLAERVTDTIEDAAKVSDFLWCKC